MSCLHEKSILGFVLFTNNNSNEYVTINIKRMQTKHNANCIVIILYLVTSVFYVLAYYL